MNSALRIAVGVTLFVLFAIPLLAQPDIAYVDRKANSNRIMLMEADGSNRTFVHAGVKFSPFSMLPSLSPDGEWIAFRDTDDGSGVGAALYKVRSDGSGYTKVMCSAGAFADGTTHGSVYFPKWSPNGISILVVVPDGNSQGAYIAAIPAAAEVGLGATGDDCRFETAQWLYHDGQTSDCGTCWGMEGNPVWDPDGSQIAVFEMEFNNGERDDSKARLLVIEAATGSVVHNQPIDWTHNGAEEPPTVIATRMDWQRDPGNLITFTNLTGSGRDEIWWVSWVDVDSGEWDFLTEGCCMSWSPNEFQAIYIPPMGHMTVVTLSYDGTGLPTGIVGEHSLGNGGDPDWKHPLSAACGNGLCEQGEDYGICPVDCSMFEWGTEPPENPSWCSDNLDNDGDGLFDLADFVDCCPIAGDQDSDGYDSSTYCAGNDCNDNDPDVNPGAPEVCSDEVDNDCNGDMDCDDPACVDLPGCDQPPYCSQFRNKRFCNADPSCYWDPFEKLCVSW